MNASYIGRNIHSGHRFLQVFIYELDDTLSADIDVYPGRAYVVRWRYGGMVAECATAEAAEAAFRLALVGTRFEGQAGQSESKGESR